MGKVLHIPSCRLPAPKVKTEEKSGELINLFCPKKSRRFGGLQDLYGKIVLEPWQHMIDTEGLIARLVDESEDGTSIHKETYQQVCADLNIEPDTVWEIYLTLHKNGIFTFLE